jgi:hypothetical protein
MTWGDEHYAPAGPRRVFTHDADDGELDAHGVCAVCGDAVTLPNTVVAPGPGLSVMAADAQDALTLALREPRPMLQPFDIMQ